MLFCGICNVTVWGLRSLSELVYPCSVGESGGVWFWGGGSGIFPPCRCGVLRWGIGVLLYNGGWAG